MGKKEKKNPVLGWSRKVKLEAEKWASAMPITDFSIVVCCSIQGMIIPGSSQHTAVGLLQGPLESLPHSSWLRLPHIT